MLADWAVRFVNTIVTQILTWFKFLLDAIDAWYLYLGAFALAMFVLLILMPFRGNGFSDRALPAIGIPSRTSRNSSDRANGDRHDVKRLGSGGE